MASGEDMEEPVQTYKAVLFDLFCLDSSQSHQGANKTP